MAYPLCKACCSWIPELKAALIEEKPALYLRHADDSMLSSGLPVVLADHATNTCTSNVTLQLLEEVLLKHVLPHDGSHPGGQQGKCLQQLS